MPTINYVVEGKYKGAKLIAAPSSDFITVYKTNAYGISAKTISSYEVIDETKTEKYSMWKGALGVLLLGGLGAAAGIRGNKKKEYLIAIEWEKNKYGGEKSLILLDEYSYKIFIKIMFKNSRV